MEDVKEIKNIINNRIVDYNRINSEVKMYSVDECIDSLKSDLNKIVAMLQDVKTSKVN